LEICEDLIDKWTLDVAWGVVVPLSVLVGPKLRALEGLNIGPVYVVALGLYPRTSEAEET